ncbi:hypothetical protein [Micromonospora maritima]|uniref:hypothetical protein n=1 Tax=Micromonospora maritima TaxID=986711 RepID=UPI001FE99CF0|nr:hypothetical protein [Micromonospora maritima]
MTIGVLLLARPQSAAWMAVPVVARTVWPPAPPVVPPFWLAKPVAVTAAADACGDGIVTATAPPTTAVARRA